MLKKYFVVALFCGILCRVSAATLANTECFIREDILPATKYDFHTNNVNNLTKPQPAPEQCNENVCPVNIDANATVTTQQEEKFSPCEELQRNPNELLKQTVNDEDINAVLSYYETLGEKLNLTEEQKIKANEIMQAAAKKMVENYQIINSKKAEILSLKSAEDQTGVERKVKYAEKYIAKLQANQEKIKKQLDKEYCAILTTEQKTIYQGFKKTDNN